MDNEFRLNENDYYSFVIIPPSGTEAIKWRVRKWVVWSTLSAIGVVILAVIISVVFATRSTIKITNYEQLRQDVVKQDVQLKRYQNDIQGIRKALQKLIEREEEMEKTLGPKRKKKRRRSKKKTSWRNRKINRTFRTIARTSAPIDQKIDDQLESIKAELVTSERHIRKMYRRLENYKERFASTPSIMPVYGRILSDYGWRVHPKSGKMQFHKGVDIPSWVGAPVKATADGVVEFAGWAGGYGWLIIIGHEYGYRSLYAHLSEILISTGQPLQKGQIIGKIGETGITTGPHIHYEIRRWSRSVSPNKHLKLDLFTATTRLW
ncbi:M23 family metallopeptidase [bacterium]|jgi:murein DD-endopeptidase MepM/ murein hydrolase activator NlpD|nr:M23 family metallopeptidase [bacterium]